MTAQTDLLQGSLDLLILKSLVLGPLHGWGISKRLRQLSGDVLEINQVPSIPRFTVWRGRAGSRPSGATRPRGAR